MIERLRPGHLHGQVIKSLNVSGFILTEAEHEAGSRLPRHAHDNSYFCFVLRGSYNEKYGRHEIACRPSTLVFRGSWEEHEAHVLNAHTSVFVLEIAPRWIDRLREESLTITSTSQLSSAALTRLSISLNREFHKTDAAAPLAIEGLAVELLAEAVRCPATRGRTIPLWLRKARELIAEHFTASLSLTTVAAQVGIHPVHLATTFRRTYGLTIGEFVRRLRIEAACKQLAKRDLSLATIAVQAGFADQSHFSKIFKSHMGLTPAKYRKSIQTP